MKQNSDTTRKRGNAAGYWFFRTAHKIFGLNGCYLFLYLVVPYYVLFDRKAVQSVMPYIRRRFPKAEIFRAYKHAFLVFMNLGKQLINRHVFQNNKESFNVSSEGYDKLLKLADSTDKGFIILTSHIGNWQLALKTLEYLNRTVNILMRPEENQAAEESLRLNSYNSNIKIISPTDENLGGIIEIMNALKQGEIVAITGDRSYGSDVASVDFLGNTAFFPYSAFKIAAGIECPIAVLLTHQKSLTEYTVDLKNLLFPKYTEKGNKLEQLRPWLQEYADIIAAFIKKYPYDCFIFYDIWRK